MAEKPLRILLVNSNRFHDPMPIMPIGLCLVAASLRAAGHTIKLLDLCFSQDTAADILKTLTDFQPNLVGVSIRNIDTCNGFQPHFLIDDVLRDVIEPLKAAFSGLIVLGGAAAGISGKALLDHYGLDCAVHGDGEPAMVELARRLSANQSLDDCPGLVIRTAAGLRQNPAHFVADLDSLPLSAVQDFLDLTEYRAFGSPFALQSKRGCALNCSYCTYNQIEGIAYRLRSPRSIAAEIADLVAATGYRRLEFVDSTFNVPLDHAKAVLREIIDLKLELSLSTMGLNPRFIDEELIDLMVQSGFSEISLGVESACDLTLQGLGKNFSVQDIKSAGALVRASGIPTMWYLLLGGPGETRTTVRNTLRTIGRIAGTWNIVNIGIGVRAYAGSPIARQMAAANPAQAQAGFFRPVAYQPTSISIPVIKAIAARACVWRHNFLMFDDGANINPQFSKSFTQKFPRQPIWRAYVIARFVSYFTPIWLFQVLVNYLFSPLIRQGLRKRHRKAMALDQAA